MSAPVTSRILGYRETQILRLVQTDIETSGDVRSYRRLAGELGMSRHHAADTVRRLERRGLIARIGSGRDRRIELARGNCIAAPDPVKKGDDRRRCENV